MTALKTVSMYIRAAKTEAEEAGLATDGMADSVSELRSEILRLTGQEVDIMDGDKYKSTVQVLRELSEIWDELSDTTRTNITEMLGGGVRNANIISALMNSFDTVEEVLEKTTDSTGSALAENEKYLDSIAGKTAQFQAAFETLSSTAINPEIIKGGIEFGTSFLNIVTEIVDGLGLIPTLLTGIGTAMSVLGTKSALTPFTWDKIGGYQYNGVGSEIFKSFQDYQKEVSALKALENALSSLNRESADFDDNISNYLNALSDGARDFGDQMVSNFKAEKDITGASKEYSSALIKEKSSTFAAQVGQIALNAAYSLATTAIVSLITYGITQLITARQREIDQAKEAAETYNAQVKSTESYREEIEELKKELNSGKLSYEESITVREKLLSIQDSLINSYGLEARNLDLLGSSVDQVNDKLDDLSKNSATKYLLQNAAEIEDAVEQMEKSRTFQISDIMLGTIPIEAQEAFNDIISSYDGVELVDSVDSSMKTLRITAENAREAEKIVTALGADISKLDAQLAVDGKSINDILVTGSAFTFQERFGSWLDELDSVFENYELTYDTQIQAKIASGGFTNQQGIQQSYHSLMTDLIALQDKYQDAITGSYATESEREAAIAETLDKIKSSKESLIALYEGAPDGSFDKGVYEYLLDLYDQMGDLDVGEFVAKLAEIPSSPTNELTREFGKLTDEVKRASAAVTELDEKLSEPDYDANYKKDIEYFKALQEEIAAGRFGSKRYKTLTEYFGVSGKSVGEVKQWADTTSRYYDEVGENAQDFLSTVEELNEAGALARDVMSYDSATGEFWFDPGRISEALSTLSGFTEDTLTNMINYIRTLIPDWVVEMPVRTVVDIDGKSTEMAFDLELSELQRIADANGIELAYDDNGAILNAEDLLKVIESLPEDTDVEIELNGETIKTIDAIKELVEMIKYLKAQNGIAPTINQSANLSTGINKSWQSDRYQVYATGSRSAYGGPALLGDEYSPTGSPKPELVVSDGEAYLAGSDGPVVHNLKPGDRVYSYSDTKRILSGGKVNFKVPAFDGGKLSFGASGGSNSGGTTKPSYDLENDELHDLYEKRIAELDHAIFLLEKNGGKSGDIISVYNQLMQTAHDEAERLRTLGVAENDEAIMELQRQWWEYHDAIVDIEAEVQEAREEALEDAKSATEELIDYRIDMLKQDLENQKDTLNKELDAISDFYDEQRDLLNKAKEEKDYEKEQTEKRRAVSDIKAEIDMLKHDDSAWAQKRIAELQSDLANAEEDLASFEEDRALDLALENLDAQEEAQTAQIESEIEAIDAMLNDPEALYNKALADIQNNSKALYEEMVAYNNKYGSGNPEDIAEMWSEAFKFFNNYIETYGEPYKGITLTDVSGYASGTSHATPGLHEFDEAGAGSEAVFTAQDGTRYRMFRGGDKVLNPAGTDFLYKFAETHGGNLTNTIGDMINGLYMQLVNGLQQKTIIPEIRMGDIIVQGNADEKTVSQIRREQRSSVEFLLKELGKLKS